MCGITGFTWEDKDLLRKMTDVISYRGPDNHGYFADKDISLGHRRLSIIDLSKAGHQPMSDKEGSITIVFNGEIYNFKEIRKELETKYDFASNTDTEVLIYGYREWGPEALLKRLNGMFAFSIWDSEKKSLFLARDRLGIKPLYYTSTSEGLVFGSELKSILQCPDIARAIDLKALNSYLTYRFIPSDATMVMGIRKLMPGHYAIYKDGRLKISKYWDISFSKLDRSEDYFRKGLKSLLMNAVDRRLLSDVPLGAYLSGGLDSSLVVAMNSRLREDPVKTFTIGFGHETDEFKHARKVADHLGTDHHELVLDYSRMTEKIDEVVWHMDEPNSDITMFPLFFLAGFSRKKVTVVNTGEGADELFGGYQHYMAGSPKLGVIPDVFKSALYSWYYSPFKASQRSKLLKRGFAKEQTLKTVLSGKANGDLLDRILLFDIKNELPNWQLTRVDRMTMAVAQEARVPFLDHEVVEFSARLPSNLKINSFTGKYLLKRVAGDYLPKSIIERYKQGFTTPMHDWLSEDLLSISEQLLSRDALKGSPLDWKYCDRLIKVCKIRKAQRPFQRHAYQTIVLTLFESWRKNVLAKV